MVGLEQWTSSILQQRRLPLAENEGGKGRGDFRNSRDHIHPNKTEKLTYSNTGPLAQAALAILFAVFRTTS